MPESMNNHSCDSWTEWSVRIKWKLWSVYVVDFCRAWAAWWLETVSSGRKMCINTHWVKIVEGRGSLALMNYMLLSKWMNRRLLNVNVCEQKVEECMTIFWWKSSTESSRWALGRTKNSRIPIWFSWKIWSVEILGMLKVRTRGL